MHFKGKSEIMDKEKEEKGRKEEGGRKKEALK